MSSGSHHLSRRERQIMDIIFARGEATAAAVNSALPD
jgi:predicted transcriptional regulator